MSVEIELPPVTSIPGVEEKPPDQRWFIPSDPEQGVYRFIIAAAKRARQLQAGARPLISTTSRKPTKIAMEEIRQGAIPVELFPEEKKPEELEAAEAAEMEPAEAAASEEEPAAGAET